MDKLNKLNNFIYYLVVFFIILVAFWFYQSYFLLVLLILLVAFPIISYILTFIAFKSVKFTLITEQSSYNKDQQFNITLSIRNTFLIPILSCIADFSIYNKFYYDNTMRKINFSLTGLSQAINIPLNSKYCGLIACNISNIEFKDFLGFFSFNKKVNLHTFVSIMPFKEEILLKDYNSAIDIKENLTLASNIKNDDGSEVININDYQPGDKLQKIHWKLSSKADSLLVKDTSEEIDNELMIIFELSNDNINDILDTLYSLSYYLLAFSLPFSINWYSNNLFNSSSIVSEDSLNSCIFDIYASESQEYPFTSLELFKSKYPEGTALYVASSLPTDLEHSSTVLFQKLSGKVVILKL